MTPPTQPLRIHRPLTPPSPPTRRKKKKGESKAPPRTTFADVAGVGAAKEELEEVGWPVAVLVSSFLITGPAGWFGAGGAGGGPAGLWRFFLPFFIGLLVAGSGGAARRG